MRGGELSGENTGDLHFTPEGAKIFAEAMHAEVDGKITWASIVPAEHER